LNHITLRVADLAVASSAFTAVLDELEINQTTSTPSFSVWGNFALTQTDEEHPIARRVHIAFIAPTPPSESTTSRRQPLSTQRSALPPASRSGSRLPAGPRSLSAHQTALS
jgi:hypothetical protein